MLETLWALQSQKSNQNINKNISKFFRDQALKNAAIKDLENVKTEDFASLLKLEFKVSKKMGNGFVTTTVVIMRKESLEVIQNFAKAFGYS